MRNSWIRPSVTEFGARLFQWLQFAGILKQYTAGPNVFELMLIDPQPCESASMNFDVQKLAGSDAVKQLKRYRDVFPDTGDYPFIIGDEDELAELKELQAGSTNETMTEALLFNTNDWMADREAKAIAGGLDKRKILGEWKTPDTGMGSIVSLHKDIASGHEKPVVHMGLARIVQPWHLPAVVGFGGSGDCPAPAVHCAFLKKWQEQFDAEITGLSSDTLECVVKSPPVTETDAMALAWEQFWYCPGSVDQGSETIAGLAMELYGANYWFFWWD